MSRRDDLLEELGLGPRWVRRDAPAAPSGEIEAAPPVVETPRERAEVTARTEAPAPATRQTPVKPAAAAEASVTEGTSAERAEAILRMDWAALEAEVSVCQACGLCARRNKTVFGVGDREADWLFVGEGPGADEDAKGEPFVGQAGKLLDNMLAAIGLVRGQDVYIANIVKCRPPGNRNPEPGEARQCMPYLQRQVDLIRPRLIVALGKVAATNLLGAEEPITRLRGRLLDYRGIPLLVTYHPAYLLRSLAEKAKAWEDLCFARETMARLRSGDGPPGDSPDRP